ncbi:hypothetical protein Tco_0866899 [Tanacetum coccineum]
MKSSFMGSGGREGGRKKDKTKETYVSNSDVMGVDSRNLVIPGNDVSMNQFPCFSHALGRQNKSDSKTTLDHMDSHLYHGADDADKQDGFMDPKIVEGVDKPVSTIPKSFASLVTSEAVTCKVNFRSLDLDKPINAKAEVKISKASILDVHSRFGFSLYDYFVGKRIAFLFASIEGMNGVLENGPWFIRLNFQHASSSHDTNVGSKEGDELGSNGGSSNSGKKVVQDMIEGMLVLLDDDGKPLKPSKLTLPSSSNVVSKKVDDLVNEDNDNEVEEKNHGDDPYDDDDFDDPSLTDAQMKFANDFDINLRDQLR